MKTLIGELHGNEWEDYCHAFLNVAFSDYQRVPDRYRGDYGIESFTVSGKAFQFYCSDFELISKEIYNHQYKKIERDIKKLNDNSSEIQKILGDSIKIKEWIFLTPIFENKDLLILARKLEQKVISWRLSFIDNDFTIFIKTDQDYITFVESCYNLDLTLKIHYLETEIKEDLIRYGIGHDFISNTKDKLGKIIDKDKLDQYVKKYLSFYVKGQEILKKFENDHNKIFERIRIRKNSFEKDVEIKSPLFKEPDKFLVETMDSYKSELKNEFEKYISPETIDSLSREAISDWIGRCPLDFGG